MAKKIAGTQMTGLLILAGLGLTAYYLYNKYVNPQQAATPPQTVPNSPVVQTPAPSQYNYNNPSSNYGLPGQDMFGQNIAPF